MLEFLKKRWRNILIVAVCVIAIAVTGICYALFAESHIFEESNSHLLEIYEQINTRLSKQIEDDRHLLDSWKTYIGNALEIINNESLSSSERQTSKEQFDEFMQEQKETWGFTDFYFVKRPTVQQEEEDSQKEEMFKYSYTCRSPFAAQEITIRFRRSLSRLLSEDKGGVIGVINKGSADEKSVVMFAVRIDGSVDDNTAAKDDPRFTYDGFRFSTIGVCFDAARIIDMFDINVFDQKGEFYIALSNGTVLLQANGVDTPDFLDYLRSGNCTIRKKNIQKIEADWNPQMKDDVSQKQQESGVFLLKDKTDKIEKYVTYMPIGFGDWMLVGMAPSDTVNASMSWFRTVTLLVMAVIFLLMLAAVVWVLVARGKSRQQMKDLEIKSREQLLDLLTAKSNNLFILFLPDTFTCEYVSANVAQVLGLDTDVVKADVHRILDAAVDAHAAFTAETLAQLSTGRTWETDIRMRNVADDTQYWYKLTLFRSVYDGKDSYIMMFSDRTTERKMNTDLEDAFRIAKSANEAKSNFLSNMSHDIRTPMNAIIGYATLVAKDAEKPDKVREYVRKIAFSSQHLLSLINDILDMSKIESGKTSLNVGKFNFSDFLEELHAMVSSQSSPKQQTFELHTKGILPEYVVGDKLRLNQILLNLLSNAVKYTPEHGQIDLCVEALQERVTGHVHLNFTVKDNGMGMSEEFVKVIFEPFSRENTPATKEIQGTGLGMTITKNIVDLMGGTISVQSAPNQGSTFTVEIELPVANDTTQADNEFWKKNNISRILVVDDEESVCTNIREMMEDFGVDVQYALGGKQAIKMLSKCKNPNKEYNVILLDWKMPEMDGVQAATEIRKIVGNDVPIMVLTSYNYDEIEVDLQHGHIDYFLPKPFFVSNFRNAMTKMFGLKQKVGNGETVAARENISIAGLKVLAAEDNEINAEILCELMDIEDVTCDIAENGQVALQKFEQSTPEQYDMIFMDVQMPVMNGYEATRAIRACAHPRAKEIPIIAMTANAFDDDVKAALDAGMNAHLAKPIDVNKLKSIISQLRGEK